MSEINSHGYRLETLEVYNWGTFNGLYRLNTNTHTALLTGKNGSGKSTLVDALLTLLVPYRGAGGRNYNQAAGTSGKERSETSYVRGAYGQRTDESTGKTKTLYLRDEKSYSVLLAVFDNPTLEKTVTIAIVFWISSGKLTKFHVVADRPLNVLQHFQVERDIGRTLKRALRNLDGVEVYNSFTKYNASLTRKLHLGEKAVTLFNQIVSIKDITGLNEFVRQHMLEEYNSQAAIDDLRGYYNNLTVAYEAIEKAENQLNFLEPLLNIVGRHRDQQGRIEETNHKISTVEIYISAIQKDFLEVQIEELEAQIREAEIAFQQLEKKLTSLTEERRALQRDIDNDDLGQRLQQLEAKIKDLEEKTTKRKGELERYLKPARRLDLAQPNSVLVFEDNRKIAQRKLDNITKQRNSINEERIGIKVQIQNLRDQGNELSSEIESLRQRKSQIPRSDILMRQQLVDALDVAEDAFPFVGELLKVREDYEDWEPAIQRLLGGFGRQLLIPNQYYVGVADYVDRTNLKGRLIYHHVKDSQTMSEDNLADNALYHRLQIKTDSPFRNWLREKIINSYSYVCTDTSSEFYRAKRAITINGQVKHGGARHEKDDRYRLGDRTRYVLGWENEAKIRLLEDDLKKLQDGFSQLAKRDKQLQSEQQKLESREKDYNQILFFESFDDLDTETVSQILDRTRSERNSLQSQAEQSQLAQLREQLKATEQKIHNTDKEKGNLNRELGRLEGDYETQSARLQRIETILATVDMEAITDLLNQIHTELIDIFGAEPSLENSEKAERQLRTHYSNQLEGQNTRLRAMEREAIALMEQFKSEYRVETQDVDASLETPAIQWYEGKYEQIQHHDLPRYKADFEELVRKKVTDSITSFRSGMMNQVHEYRKRIDQLNESLKQIPYTSETYIQLTYQDTADQQIRAFNTDLNNCFPNVNVHGDEANKQAYLNVRNLIERLDNETYWATKVTDVRNWLDFAADERRQSDDSQQERYEGASGKSGGQKAKLAYTIMASAIAYQYGIFATRRDPSKTFRFVVVDEVFSKSDESNSRFAMDLFRQLGLQVLVVTPSDKIHIVEPYIGICHWVKNTDEGSDSRVTDISVEQLRQTRDQLGAAD